MAATYTPCVERLTRFSWTRWSRNARISDSPSAFGLLVVRHERLGAPEVHSLRHGTQTPQPQIDRHPLSHHAHGLAPFRRRTRTSSVDAQRNEFRRGLPGAVESGGSNEAVQPDHVIAAAAERLRSTSEVGR